MIRIRDVRGTKWFVRRTNCRHYQASRDGVKFTRCHLQSIATVFGFDVEFTKTTILGEK